MLAVTNAFGTPDETLTQYSYDEAGNLIKQTDANGHETIFEYDEFNRRIKRILPGAVFETVDYQVIDHKLREVHTDFHQAGQSGRVLWWNFDEMNRLAEREYRTRLIHG